MSRADNAPIDCLMLAQSDPVSGALRAGPLRRYSDPPVGVRYRVATDRLRYPGAAGYYHFSPLTVGVSAARFAIEHSLPLTEKDNSLVHMFFWDVRKFSLPWVHESDQSFGQFLSGYANVGGFVKRTATRGYSVYLNSRKCKGVITWSEWARRGFLEDGVRPDRVFVIPPPFRLVDDRRPHPSPTALFIGRDFKRKGGDIAIRAFQRARLPAQSKLIYVGKVREGEARRRIAGDGRIVHLENPDGRTMRDSVWPEADVLILPTRSDAFAITVVEAMCRGIPPVTSQLPPIAEVVQDGKSGLLAKPGDAEALSVHLERLLGDEGERARMGASSRQRALELFSPDRVNGKLAKVYADAVR